MRDMRELKDFKDLPYTRPNFEEAEKKFADLTDRVKKATIFEEIKEVIGEFEAIYGDIHTNIAIAMIRAYLDSSDEYYNSEMSEGSQKEAVLNYNDFYNALLNSPFNKDIDKEFGNQFLLKLKDNVRLKSKGMDLIEKEQELIFKYQNLKATLRIDFDGKSLSEGQIRKYTTSEDRETRKAATDALSKAYMALRDDFSSILSELIKIRNQIAKVNGFETYADYMNLEKGRRDYGQKELLEFCESVKEELLDFLLKVNEDKAKRLGLDKLKYYDTGMSFPDGNAVPKGNGEVLAEKAKQMYNDLDEEIGNLYTTMVDKNYLDVSESPNKISGIGFCTEIYNERLPYVFGNCTGSIHDVDVMTHEVGHAYQVYLSLNKQPLYSYSSMPNDVVEIPSKAMEHFTQDYAELFFEEDTEKFKQQFLEGSLKEVLTYCAIHEFESWLYLNEEATPEERAAKYFELLSKTEAGVDYSEVYENGLGESLLFKSMGVYMFPFYLISYAISAMSAMELAKRMAEDKKDTWKDYRNLCSAGGSLSYNELLKAGNLKSPFEKETIKESIGNC